MDAVLQNLWKTYVWNTESRSVNLENPKTVISGHALDQILGGNISGTGRPISHEGILTLSAVYRAVAIKAGLISSLPFQVFKKSDKGRILLSDKDHPTARLLSKAPNNKMNKVIYMDRALRHFELLGNHYAYIQRDNLGQAIQFNLEHPNQVEVIETRSTLTYKVKGIEGLVPASDMIHVPNMGDDCIGKSVIGYMRDDASLMFDIRGYGESFFGRGGKPAGLLIPKAPVTNPQRAETKQSFQEAKKSGGDVAMPFGWEYKEISVPPAEAEWVVSNGFTISTVARWFGVPTQKLGDSAVKYSNVEFMGIEFLQDTMSPIASKFEAEYTNKAFQLDKEEDLYAEINLDAYLRADSVTKAEQYSKYVQNGIKSPNEIRKYNNDPEKEGGDDLFMQSGTVPITMLKQMLLSKTPAQRQSLGKKIEKKLSEGISPQLILEELFKNGKELHLNGKH